MTLSSYSLAIILSLIFSLPASAQRDSVMSDSIRPARTWSGFVAIASPRLFWDSTGVSGFAVAGGPEWYWMYTPAASAAQIERLALLATVAVTCEVGYLNDEFFAAPALNLHGGIMPLFIGGSVGPRFSKSGVDLWGRLCAGAAFGPLKAGLAVNKRLFGELPGPDRQFTAFIDIPIGMRLDDDSEFE